VAFKEILGCLLGKRTAALNHSASPNISEQGADDAEKIHAVMVEKIMILRRNYGLNEIRRDVRVSEILAVVIPEKYPDLMLAIVIKYRRFNSQYFLEISGFNSLSWLHCDEPVEQYPGAEGRYYDYEKQEKIEFFFWSLGKSYDK